MFTATAIVGWTTKVNLTGLRGFLLMGLIGMIIVYAASRAEANAMTVFGNLFQALVLFWLLDVCIRHFSRWLEVRRQKMAAC